MALVLFISQTKDKAPGGSNHGIKASKKKIVIGVVFHINLHPKSIHSFFLIYILDTYVYEPSSYSSWTKEKKLRALRD